MLFDWEAWFRDFNPLDNFWKLTYPLFNPRPGSSARINPPSPIWDLPSPYGQVQHPENKDSIPHFVHPDYFQKLYTEPEHEVVSYNPPIWMVVENFNKKDLFFKFPLCLLTAPVFMFTYHRIKRTSPSWYTWFSAGVLGSSLGFTVCYQDSENRLQGFLKNDEDVKYWKERAVFERQVLEGKIDPKIKHGMVMRGLDALFGVDKVDLNKAEEEYYKNGK